MPYAVIVVSAILTGAALILPPLWFLVWVGPIPFLLLLLTSEHNPKSLFWTGLLFGTAFNGIAGLSVWAVYPLDWIGITMPFLSSFIVGVVWLATSASMGLAYGALSSAFSYLRTFTQSKFLLVLSLGLLWICTEWLAAVLWSIFLLGPMSVVGAHFTLGSIGYALGHADSAFWISLARWGGVPLLSFFPVVIAACVAYGIIERTVKSVLIVMAIWTLFILASIGAGISAEHSRGHSSAWKTTNQITIVAGQTNFPPTLIQTTALTEKKTNVAYDIAKIVRDWGFNLDVLILPEGIGTLLGLNNYEKISNILPPQSLLIHSNYPSNEHGVKRVQTHAHIIGTDDIYITEKQFLMPYGESPPYHFLVPLQFISPSNYESVIKHRLYASGPDTSLGAARSVAIGVRICSEIFTPSLYRSLSESYGAGVLVHASSIGIFHGNSILPAQMRSAARIRAVENGLPIIQSLNGAEGTAYDCRGKEIKPTLQSTLFKIYILTREAVCQKE